MQIKGKVARLGLTVAALAAVAGGSLAVSSGASAQAPQSVPVARFYGYTTVNGGNPVTNLTITGSVGTTVCSGTQAGVGGSGTVNNTNYFVDIQAVPGCTTPGATVIFTASSGSSGTYRAKETGTIPDIPGTAVHLNLDFQLPPTPTSAPPPPPPPTAVRTATPAGPPPSTATRPAATPTPAPVRTATAPAVQRGVVQQAPKGPVKSQGPKYGAGGYYQAPATSPRLPNTGTGGLLDEQTSNGLTGWALAVIVLAALGVSATGLMAYRRGH
jgi:hypothetical protein